MDGHKAVVPSSIHLRSGASSRRRHRVSDATNSEGVPTKRRRTSSLSISDSQLLTGTSQPVACSVGCSDQCVPTQSHEQLSPDRCSEGYLPDFYNDAILSKEEDKQSSGHPLGYFASLPTELFHGVLSLLESSDLATLASVSSEMCSAVCGYVYSPGGLHLVLPQYSEGNLADTSEFSELGE